VERRRASRASGTGVLTFVAVLVSCVLLLAAGANQAMYPLGGLIIVAVALTVLVSLRQSVALRAHARLAVEYRKVAATDVLTGLLSRRALLEEAEGLLAAAQQRDRALSVLMIDLDHFKTINDTFGHAVGDQVLITVAAACRSALPQALIGRYGGDELVAVLPDTEPGHARDLADALALTLRDTAHTSATPTPAVTLSIGVASAKGRRDLDAVLAAADLALYDAKAAGRACTRVSSMIPAPR
jgi:diguanylate cyclase (GGDEF)-like protein